MREKILKHRYQICLALVVTAAAALRLFRLPHQVVWVDEAWTIINVGSMPLRELIKMIGVVDYHPPLYYIFLHYWIKLFGSGPLAARFPSLLFDLGSLLLVYRLGTLWGEPEEAEKTGLTAAVLYGSSALLISCAQEARMYPMLNFFLLSSLLFYYRALTENRFRDWAGYTLFAVLAIYTHYFAFHILIAFWLSYFILLIFRKISSRTFPFFCFSLFSLFILYLPWAGVFADRFFSRWRIRADTPLGLLLQNSLGVMERGQTLSVYNNLSELIWEGLLLLCPLAGLIFLGRRPVKLILSLLYLVFPLGVSVLLPHLTGKQTYNPVHLMVLLGVLFLLWGVGFRVLLKIPVLRILPYPLLFIYLCFNGLSLYNWDFNSFFQRENWPPVVTKIAAMEKPGDIVLVQTAHRGFPFRYNFKGKSRVIPTDNFSTLPSNALLGQKRVWLVENCSDVTDPQGTLREFMNQIGRQTLYYREDNYIGTGIIEIRLFELTETR